jgi:glycosyltransferase involved in cell wall biosynthesis
VTVVAPEYADEPADETGVIRIPAIQNFNGSDFSVVLPIPHFLSVLLRDFEPDVVHSHHPFLLGSTALRIATEYAIPLVTTHHTKFEEYLHYVPVSLPRMRQFVIRLAVGYENLCDYVIAPSRGVADQLTAEGMRAPMQVIPTGVRLEVFSRGDGGGFRKRTDIAPDRFVVGHVGRLAREKNLGFLTGVVTRFLQQRPRAVFLLVGQGPYAAHIREHFDRQGLAQRLVESGHLEGQDLVDAYHAMDVFVFSSKSETQGMVLNEAMAAGVPVVALRATGVDDVVTDGRNGFLLDREDEEAFAQALVRVQQLDRDRLEAMTAQALVTARANSMERCARRILDIYDRLVGRRLRRRSLEDSVWRRTVEQLKTEWNLFTNFAGAAADSIRENGGTRKTGPGADA